MCQVPELFILSKWVCLLVGYDTHTTVFTNKIWLLGLHVFVEYVDAEHSDSERLSGFDPAAKLYKMCSFHSTF